MTKEQEVIKNIKTYIHDWVNESVDEDGYERYVIDEWDKEFMNDIETVLNMLKEKDKEIEKYKNMIIEHKKQLRQSGIYGYDYDLKID